MNLSKTIDNKPIITKDNGEMLYDLTKQNFKPADRPTIIDYIIVSDEFSMRVDLISMAAYRDISAVDLILKQNSISNPFSIDKDDVIYIQERREINNQFVNLDKISNKNKVRNQYLDPDKAPKIDANLKKFIDRQKPETLIADRKLLPPNFANFGDEEIKLSGGNVIYGGDISNTQEPKSLLTLSKSELLKKITKANISTKNIEKKIV